MSHYATTPSVYRVLISATGLGGAAPADGFIDATKMEQYLASGGTAPTLPQTLAKKRANSRYEMLILSMQQPFNFSVSDIVATDASSVAPATAFQFDIRIERGDAVLETADEDNVGIVLTGSAALKRLVARGLMIGRTDRCEYVDPTSSNVPAGQDNAGAAGVRRGTVVTDLVVSALTASLTTAESKVTITAI